MRECARVLRPGGRLGVLPIETPPGLAEGQIAIAERLGPSAVRAEASLEEMVLAADLSLRSVEDVTTAFERTVEAIVRELEDSERMLREAEGDEAYEAEHEKKSDMLAALRRGVIRRTFLVAEKRRISGPRP